MKKRIMIISAILVSISLLAVSVSAVVSNSTARTKVSAINKSLDKTAAAKNLSKQKMVNDEVIVSFKKNISYTNRLSALGRLNVKKVRELSSGNAMTVKLSDETVEAAVARLKNDPSVESVQPNYIYHTTASPVQETATGSNLWGLKNTGQTVTNPSYTTNNPGTSGKDMDFENAYLATYTDRDVTTKTVVVAVVDSGVNYNQEDLANNMWDGSAFNFTKHGYDCVGDIGDDDPMDENGHGTHVAGTIGAQVNNASGATKGALGVGYNTKIMAVRVMDSTGSGTTADIVEGVNWAVNHGANIINLSLGGSTYDTAFYNALAAARDANVLVIVAAGNDGVDIDKTYDKTKASNATTINPYWNSYPAEYNLENIIVVGAVDQKYELADFSNFGTAQVDIAAPGVNIYSTWPGTNVTYTTTAAGEWSTFTSSGSAWGGGIDTTYSLMRLFVPGSSPWGSAKYTAGTNSGVFKDFGSAVGTADVAVLKYYINNVNLANYDTLYVSFWNYSFTPSSSLDGSQIAVYKNPDTLTYSGINWSDIDESIDITARVKGQTNNTLIFALKDSTISTAQGYGAYISDPTIETLTRNTTSYNTIDGTSMAAPHVAGLAGLIKGFNPDYTWQDIRDSIYGGADVQDSVNTPDLTGKISGGKVADAYGSIKFIKAPTGVTAE
jgi:thermitase